jgi:aspartate kinase
MIVFKFGGASVKNADAVKNLKSIIDRFPSDKIVVVISAMGKMTNALEEHCNNYFHSKLEVNQSFAKIKDFHFEIINNLFEDKKHYIFSEVETMFAELEKITKQKPSENFPLEYDKIVSFGELLSTKIVSIYLNKTEKTAEFVDIRPILKTDETHQEGKVNWFLTEKLMKERFDFSSSRIYITQGFIGSTNFGKTTTLGREGSDFTAAIIANSLNAENVTIWKDVAGVLNADPKWFDNTQKLHNISYHEAIELSYFGATVIHPKTIKPLQNKDISLFVKSFISPSDEGTVINNNIEYDKLIPSFIFKMNQVLLSISPRDLSFIVEDNLSEIFAKFSKYRLKVNLMQNSAVSFSVCIDNIPDKISALIKDLDKEYKVLFNADLELATIRHYNQDTIDRVLTNKKVYLEQKTRHTARFVMKTI